MTPKEKLNELRGEIDAIDRELIALFGKRMDVSARVGEVKTAGNMPVTDEKREQQIIENAKRAAAAENRPGVDAFMRNIIALSKIRQRSDATGAPALQFPPSDDTRKDRPTVCFQGVRGAWGEVGAGTLFPQADFVCAEYFEDVFENVKNGVCDFGVVPIENSQTGAIGEVYDLLRGFGCHIVGQTWTPIAQCLLAKRGTKLADVREVFSHPQGFGQCRRFLKRQNWDLTSCRNTALAAQMVAENADKRCAAIGSRLAAEICGLDIVAPDIMDAANNKTRFIAIAARPRYDATSAVTSVTFSTAHKAGALCAVLQTFMLAGINLSRIESRPVSVDNYRFFADLRANILDETTVSALSAAAAQCAYFEILGCYSET